MANIPTQLNNPGDLKDPQTGQFRQFSSPQEGFQALKQDLYGKMTGNTSTGLGPQSSLHDLASVWAPSSDNNDPDQYAQTLAQKLGTASTAPLASVKVDDLASAVADAEGYQGEKPGRMSVQEFAAKIKQKYPQYQNLDDAQLTQKVLAKYPIYQHSVDTAGLSIPSAPSQTSAEDTSLTAKIGKRAQDVTGALGQLSTGVSEAAQGKIGKAVEDVGSGALQTVGGVAGGIGDVIQKGAELIPGVKSLEGLIGKGIGALANTSVGKEIVKSAADFEVAHPEAAKNIGAVANIASIVPMFKAVGAVGTIAKDATAKAFEGQLARAAGGELDSAITRTIPGNNILKSARKKGFDPVTDMIDNRILPDVIEKDGGGYKFSTAKADQLAQEAEQIQEDNLRQALQKAGTRVAQPGQTGFVTAAPQAAGDATAPLADARLHALSEVEKNLRYDPSLPQVQQKINDIFDFLQQKGGETPSLNTLTDMKRDVRTGVKFDTPAHEKDARFYAGQGLMKIVEDTAAARGVPEIRDINKTMARVINVRKLLRHLDNRPIPMTRSRSWIRNFGADVLGAVGEGIGNVTGLPFAGTFAGRSAAGLLGRRAPMGALRTLQSSQKPLLNTIGRGVGTAARGALLHSIGQAPQGQRQVQTNP